MSDGPTFVYDAPAEPEVAMVEAQRETAKQLAVIANALELIANQP